ncbi:beta-ketoacyl synthase [Antarcticibacterium arcticum]|uniref:Beta-ketoacyl synthase n=1 Tax=Antarcticibacterium arcticum TaxID=2585771 RepID=A0A5B8YK58_9FLAO|nr:beta-ketoacyl synthase N-terminal-like domain-containing protein [Antarcticibacterium arcticum]QED36993.1 beta-ketoacyl synthase [Antarcticibacterium arcticum]
MKDLYLLDDAIVSPFGISTEENLEAVSRNIPGLKLHKYKSLPKGELYAGIIETDLLREAFIKIGAPEKFTKLEQMMLLAVHKVIAANPGLNITDTALIISTTKGNIDVLRESSPFPKNRIYLTELAKVIKNFFGFTTEPVVVSNACVSGGLALAVAKRLMKAGKFEQAIVVGGDLVSDFVVSGFNSFLAISDEPCKPFSADRKGISLGEAAVAVLVTNKRPAGVPVISLIGEASANDANHISGPSRTGEGLVRSMENAFKQTEISVQEIDYISAHGTATLFNDEMEAIAFNRLGLNEVPLNSFKGYYGHTLGASALLESILTKHSMLQNRLFTSLNYSAHGVSKPLHIINENRKSALNYALKTASGFGGCNLALIFKKEENGI